MIPKLPSDMRKWLTFGNHMRRPSSKGLTILSVFRNFDQMMTFVGQARKLLARLQVNAPLRAGADFLDKKNRLERQLRTFVAEFDALRTAIRGLTNQLNAVQVPSNANDPPETPETSVHTRRFLSKTLALPPPSPSPA